MVEIETFKIFKSNLDKNENTSTQFSSLITKSYRPEASFEVSVLKTIVRWIKKV